MGGSEQRDGGRRWAPHSFDELTSATDEDLRAGIDWESKNVMMWSLRSLLDEYDRRRQAEDRKLQKHLTWVMTILTALVCACTVIQVVTLLAA